MNAHNILMKAAAVNQSETHVQQRQQTTFTKGEATADHTGSTHRGLGL